MTVEYSFRFHPITSFKSVDGTEVCRKHFQLFKLLKKKFSICTRLLPIINKIKNYTHVTIQNDNNKRNVFSSI